jgi:hypothetical protein
VSVTGHSGRDAAPGLLEIEDQDLRDLFATLRGIAGASLEVRSRHGHIATDAVRHLATWEGPDSAGRRPDGPAWWERAPLVSPLLTAYDRLRALPRGNPSLQ